jgi:hypothetical protein
MYNTPRKEQFPMSDCPKCTSKAIYDPPQTVFEDYYHPQHVDVVHQVQVIRRHHCVPVYHHTTTVSVKDVFCGDFEGQHARTASLRGKRR